MIQKSFQDLFTDELKFIADKRYAFDEEPVSMQEFIESSFYLNLKDETDPNVLKILLALDNPETRQAYLTLGKGSGKSFIASIMQARMVYWLLCLVNPQRSLSLAPNSSIVALNLAINEDQAKRVVFHEFLMKVKNSKWFQERGFREKGGEVNFPKNVMAASGHGRSTAWHGYNTISAVLDEAAWFTDTNKRSVVQECFDAVYGSCQSRFPKEHKIICISSPRYKEDFMAENSKDVLEQGEVLWTL